MGDGIVIIGSGIIGLYTAFVLSRNGLANKITILAQHLPGDNSIDYTSPVAGANFTCSIAGSDPASLEYNRVSFELLDKIFKDYGAQAGLERNTGYELWGHSPDEGVISSLKSYIKDLEVITDPEFLASKGAAFGIKYTTYNFYSPVFIGFLKKFVESLGVVFIRRKLTHINEAFVSPTTQTVFNCTGVTASRLGGVDDPAENYPIRGQIVIVRAPHIKTNVSFSEAGAPPTYIIPRAHSGGRVVLGGYYQEHNWSSETYGYETASILDRTTRLWPQLLDNGPLEILEERAGLRPGRKGGARIERKDLSDGKAIIHNYGAAGTGYQAGLAMAIKAVGLYNSKLRARL